jgi:hypothetical protein
MEVNGQDLCLGCFTSRERPPVPTGGPHGPQSRSGLTKQSASPENRTAGPRSFSPLSGAYTDRAVLAVAVVVLSWHIYQ